MDRVLRTVIDFFVFLAKYTKLPAGAGIGRYEEWRPGRKLKILLVGYNGARNTGADARVAAIARQLKTIFDPEKIEITVMALNTENLQGYFDPDVKLYKFSTIFPADLYRACSVNHMAILAEGSALKSTFANALTLYMCEAAGIMRSQKKPCIAYGTEAGKMDDFLIRAAAQLCRGTYFISRTEASMEVLGNLGLKGHVGTDTAWYYDGAISDEAAKEWLKNAGWDGRKPLIGAAVIDPFCWPVRASLARWIRGRITGNMEDCYDKWYFYSRSPERTAAFHRYINGLADAVNRFGQEKDAFVVVIGMEKLDEGPCRMLAGKLHVPNALLLSKEEPAGVMTGVLRQTSLLVTSRYHAAVLSMDRAIPIAAVSMDERLDSLLRGCGLSEEYLIHTRDEAIGEKLYGRMKQADEERERVREKISFMAENGRAELDRMGIFLKKYVKRSFKEAERERQAERRMRKENGWQYL